MNIIEKFQSLAASNKKRIVLPEGEEERVLRAAEVLAKKNLVEPILIGNKETISKMSQTLGLDIESVTVHDPKTSEYTAGWAEKYFQKRQKKGVTKEQADATLLNPLFFGAFMLAENMADGAVAGSINTTGDVLRAAIQVVGLAENVSVVSSSFIMALPDGKILTFGDCAVIPDPDPDQLASIAISSARTHEKLVEEEPVVAMLSFSTKGSAQHPAVDKVVEATGIVANKAPYLKVDGELQFDAAFMESVGKKKAPGSPVAGKANVFVFPDLNSGNIGYKLTQRLAGAEAIGPVIQGLAKPYNDLSRGCSVEDVINVACICAILA